MWSVSPKELLGVQRAHQIKVWEQCLYLTGTLGPQKLLVDALSHAIVIQLEGVHFPCMAILTDFRFTSIEIHLYDHKSA